MEFRNYLGYNVYENGEVKNKDGKILIPQKSLTYYYYIINNKKISAGKIVLLAFGILPPTFTSNVKRKDGNQLNNSLKNLSW